MVLGLPDRGCEAPAGPRSVSSAISADIEWWTGRRVLRRVEPANETMPYGSAACGLAEDDGTFEKSSGAARRVTVLARFAVYRRYSARSFPSMTPTPDPPPTALSCTQLGWRRILVVGIAAPGTVGLVPRHRLRVVSSAIAWQ